MGVFDAITDPISDIYSATLKPVLVAGQHLLIKAPAITDRLVDTSLNNFDGISKLITSPMMWIGAGIVAIFVLPPLLKK